MHEVDVAVKAAVEAFPIKLWTERVPTEQDARDPEVRVISVAFPYARMLSNLGDDNVPRLGGRDMQRSVFWQITAVGQTFAQTKLALGWCRTALSGKRLPVYVHEVDDNDELVPTGTRYKTSLVTVSESQRIREDPENTDPYGRPLFYGVDLYTMRLSLRRTA